MFDEAHCIKMGKEQNEIFTNIICHKYFKEYTDESMQDNIA